jgi:hypothetical protein
MWPWSARARLGHRWVTAWRQRGGGLVPAAQVKQGPGRKPEQAEARWLATRRRYGWRQARGIPPPGRRERRELTRYRTTRVQERRREGNWVQGGRERAHSKLAAVARELMGGSGRALLAVLLEGRAALALRAAVAKGRWRSPIPRLQQALTGLGREHPRRMLASQWAPRDVLEAQSAARSGESTPCLRVRASDAPPD